MTLLAEIGALTGFEHDTTSPEDDVIEFAQETLQAEFPGNAVTVTHVTMGRDQKAQITHAASTWNYGVRETLRAAARAVLNLTDAGMLSSALNDKLAAAANDANGVHTAGSHGLIYYVACGDRGEFTTLMPDRLLKSVLENPDRYAVMGVEVT